MEEDVAAWFNAEVSNVVLAAWGRAPELLQASHAKALTERAENAYAVDVLYSLKFNGGRVPIAIGEFKRNIIKRDSWEASKPSQPGLTRELRAYADKYSCPQVFCFDGKSLLMLQFRAKTASDIKDPECLVDSWVLPRVDSVTPLRLALYRLLAQGFRRCQSEWLTGAPLLGLQPHYREFFNGRPVFEIEGDPVVKPWGLVRRMDAEHGAFLWVGEDGPVRGEDGMLVYDTQALWASAPAEIEEVDENIYDA